MTTFVEEYLLWHHFGDKTKIENMDLAYAYKESLRSLLNPTSLGPFLNSYISRSNIDMHRPEGTAAHANRKTLKCPTLLLTGSSAPHNSEVAEANGKMDPTITDYMKVSDCGGMPLEEQPHKVAQAMILFLQGNGYGKTLLL
jgi:pimeloyl-ACP methyl ester carboxylesterase